ncbi:MAG: haloacid dehalogenase type II, partial [Alphaproteobacteria bacterium]
EGEAFGRANGIEGKDWLAFADAWRGLYQPTLEKVRCCAMPWQALDDLHRMSLERLLVEHHLTGIPEAALDHFNRAWHRLDPWPDAVPGLTRLKRKYILATCSNGNVALMVNLAKYAGLPWDMILGAELALHYKPCPDAYRKSVAFLRLAPAECVMVAAHNGDLKAAAASGLRTAFVPRPTEYGPAGKPDLKPSQDWDFVADDFGMLADQLGC